MDRTPPPTVSITDVKRSRSADVHSREVRYLASMLVRTACFVLAVIVSGPLRWVFVAGAVILPYVAVVLANAADRGNDPGRDVFTPEPLTPIESKDPQQN